MTHEAQRIAIAESCGWTDIRAQKIGNDRDLWGAKDGQRNRIPDYLADLNAMHETEKVLTDETWPIYLSFLMKKDQKTLTQTWMPAAHATASTRAKAFLRTLNLYTPTPCAT
jgi:hypothetical protein